MVDSPCSFLEIRWRRRAFLITLKGQHTKSFRTVLAHQSHHHSTQNINLVTGFKRGIGIYEIELKEESPVVKGSSSMQLVPYCSGSKLLSASKCIRPPLKKPDVLETHFKLNCISKLLITHINHRPLSTALSLMSGYELCYFGLFCRLLPPPRLYDPPWFPPFSLIPNHLIMFLNTLPLPACESCPAVSSRRVKDSLCV